MIVGLDLEEFREIHVTKRSTSREIKVVLTIEERELEEPFAYMNGTGGDAMCSCSACALLKARPHSIF